MAKLADFIIQDFTGGLVTDKSDLLMADNELKDALNLEVDEPGRLKRRRGIQRFSDLDPNQILGESFTGTITTLGSSPTLYHLALPSSSNAALFRIYGNFLNGAITTSTTTIALDDGTLFSNSGAIEIDGDIIDYTGKSTDDLTTVTNIRVAHADRSPVYQAVSAGDSGVDTRAGAYFAMLNNVFFLNGRAGSATFDGSSITAVSDNDEPAGIFATNYRERIYVAGSGVANAAGTRNGSPIRVSFSDAGDSTSWDLNNFFDVEDDRGEMTTGLREINDTLLMFKQNSIFSYDETQLKQRLWNVGAYNHKVIQRIGEVIFTFCPQGVFVTNGVTSQRISDPVRKYVEAFKPVFDIDATAIQRVVTNTFAGQFQKKYYLYLGDLEEPFSRDDVVLVYDIERNKWTVHDGYTNFRHFGSFQHWVQGPPGVVTASVGESIAQSGEALFAGDSGGKYWKLFDTRFLDSENVIGTPRGGDIFPNLVDDSAGDPIQTIAETKLYNIGNGPGQWGQIGTIGVIIEQGTFQVSYRIEDDRPLGDFISLGEFTKGTTEIDLREKNSGYRIAFRITSNDANNTNVFNAIILKNRESIDRKNAPTRSHN